MRDGAGVVKLLLGIGIGSLLTLAAGAYVVVAGARSNPYGAIVDHFGGRL